MNSFSEARSSCLPNEERSCFLNLWRYGGQIFPCMVELLMQHERTTYCTRLAAIKHVTKLRATGRLSRAWMHDGYYAKMAHVLPPLPRMPRIFSPEEGDEMFERAAAR